MLGRTVKCPNCGASFEITPDALAYACKYCGWIGTTEEVEQKGYHMVDPLDFEKIQRIINDFLGKDLRKASEEVRILVSRPTAMPIWMVQVHAHTRYNGYRKETRVESYTIRVGNRTEIRTKTYPIYIPVRGEIDDSPIVPITARKHSAFFGVDEIKRKAVQGVAERLDVKKLLSKKFECLEVELVEDESRSIAETTVEDEHRARVEGMTTKLFDCYTDTDILSASLVFYPIYTVVYEYRGKSFRGVVDGSDGKIVKIELPMTFGLKVLYMGLGYLGIGGSALMAYLVQGIETEVAVYLIPILIAAASGLAFYKGTTSQRVKRSL